MSSDYDASDASAGSHGDMHENSTDQDSVTSGSDGLVPSDGSHYDGFTITGKVEIISAILGELTQVTISTYPGKGKQTAGNVLLVASTPYYIYVKEEFKAEIIAKIDEIRGVPHLPSSNKHALLSKIITMVTPQFVQVLQDAFVDSVTIVGYGQKAPIAWGQKLMQAARGTDRNCTCEFDMAAQVPPERVK